MAVKDLNIHNEFDMSYIDTGAVQPGKELVLIHGLLHLVGFSHKEEDKLKKIENQILNKVWGNGQ